MPSVPSHIIALSSAGAIGESQCSFAVPGLERISLVQCELCFFFGPVWFDCAWTGVSVRAVLAHLGAQDDWREAGPACPGVDGSPLATARAAQPNGSPHSVFRYPLLRPWGPLRCRVFPTGQECLVPIALNIEGEFLPTPQLQPEVEEEATRLHLLPRGPAGAARAHTQSQCGTCAGRMLTSLSCSRGAAPSPQIVSASNWGGPGRPQARHSVPAAPAASSFPAALPHGPVLRRGSRGRSAAPLPQAASFFPAALPRSPVLRRGQQSGGTRKAPGQALGPGRFLLPGRSASRPSPQAQLTRLRCSSAAAGPLLPPGRSAQSSGVSCAAVTQPCHRKLPGARSQLTQASGSSRFRLDPLRSGVPPRFLLVEANKPNAAQSSKGSRPPCLVAWP
ncbi:hypothetical protein NDU88_000057 [Pleurodeles waltl]|uniref:Uncharacterized protein n=1 Tax=Pleurodeles waltl TaxID=8319 RepID=A0AAV7VVC3_PLEWA|nr:hypothetical protein NDU88_000057 [Pleurodeles waltl]